MNWGEGDYATAGDLWAEVGRRLVDEVGVAALEVLDVATGTGATAIAAAQRGGRVTGLDAAPELLDIARARAAAAGAEVRWIAADMRAAPLPDAGFDRVLSTFGAMFADDPFAMARELVRLCRPGGLVVACAWTPEGVFGRIAPTVAAFLPEAPPSGPKPTDWGAPEVGRFFAGLPVELATELRSVRLRWPALAAAVSMFERKPGPIQSLRRALEPLGRWSDAREALAALLRGAALADEADFVLDVPYRVLVARRV